MTYEEENKDYKFRLEIIENRISILEYYFSDKQALYNNQMERLKRYGYNIDQFTYGLTPEFIELFKLKMERGRLKNLLSQSKFQRNRDKTLDFISGITPQHVSGRVYKVEDGDGCGKFCMWFLIIDAIIVFLLYATGVIK